MQQIDKLRVFRSKQIKSAFIFQNATNAYEGNSERPIGQTHIVSCTHQQQLTQEKNKNNCKTNCDKYTAAY